ncbi:hypothetical protein DW010_03300 [Bacteroides stercoris]|nr:hypothetical protein DW010_03300 [Bacteroides stercoris]
MRAPFAPGYPYFDIRLYRNSVIVQGVPTVGISRTKRRYYIGTYIVLIESRLLRCKGCYPIILSIHANICKHPANIRLYTNCFSAYICSK